MVTQNLPPPVHSDLINLISNKETLTQAYRTIRPNKGTMTTAAGLFILQKEYDKLDTDQQELLLKMWKMPDGIDISFCPSTRFHIKPIGTG